MAKLKVWRAATLIVALCVVSTSCSSAENGSARDEAGTKVSDSASASPPPACLSWTPPCSLPSASPPEEVWPALSVLSYKSASVRLPDKGWLEVPSAEGSDLPVMPGGVDSDVGKSAAVVYDDSEATRLSKVTVDLEVHDYDPHALGNDLDADDMRTEVTKNDLETRRIFGEATQEPSINKNGVVYDVIASMNKSMNKSTPDKVNSWRREYIGVVVHRDGMAADGVKAVIECRAEFYTESKCANLAHKVFRSLRVKKS